MTREEAKRFGHCILAVADADTDKDTIEFTKIALEALEQKPCDDAISRQAVLDRKYVVEVKNMWHMTEKIEVVDVDDIKALPSVSPQPKTGHWIDKEHYFERCSAKCSICGKFASGHSKDTGWGFTYSFTDYCPNCGAKMESEEMNEEENKIL